MTDYSAELIELLNEKILRQQRKQTELRRENDRLKGRIRELERAAADNE